MSVGKFVKLDCNVHKSSLWSESTATRCLFITLLAEADWQGIVATKSFRSLARLANLAPEEVAEGMAVLMAPDPESRSSDHDGRRVIEHERGFEIVNLVKYREVRTPRQEQWRRAQAKRRAAKSQMMTRQHVNTDKDVDVEEELKAGGAGDNLRSEIAADPAQSPGAPIWHEEPSPVASGEPSPVDHDRAPLSDPISDQDTCEDVPTTLGETMAIVAEKLAGKFEAPGAGGPGDPKWKEREALLQRQIAALRAKEQGNG